MNTQTVDILTPMAVVRVVTVARTITTTWLRIAATLVLASEEVAG